MQDSVNDEIIPPDPSEILAALLNDKLSGWSQIYNCLRNNPDFYQLASFLWIHAIEVIYKQKMPTNAWLVIEVTPSAGTRLQTNYPRNINKVETVDHGTKFFLYVDPPPPIDSEGNPNDTERVEIALMGGPGLTNLKFGLISQKNGEFTTQPDALTLAEIVGFQVQLKPSPLQP